MITRIYIGSNNKTKEVEKEKIISIINKYHKGYTIIDTMGLWEGEREASCIIEIINELVIDDMLNELKSELKQNALLVTRQELQVLFY